MERKMSYHDDAATLAAYRAQIAELRARMREVQASIEPEPVQDYDFVTPKGMVSLSGLFGDKSDLIVILNMGKACPSCT
jgi:predicted dithiol-disulfide oxidoreductase (DUF899 family)